MLNHDTHINVRARQRSRQQCPFPRLTFLSKLTAILAGDLGITLGLTTHADQFGRRKTLAVGAFLKIVAGLAFALSKQYYITVIAGILGVITPTGNDIGPFIAIEQAALSDIMPGTLRGDIAKVFGWYQFCGATAQAAGALVSGWSVATLQGAGFSTYSAFRVVIFAYAAFGGLLLLLYCSLSADVEARPQIGSSPTQASTTTLRGLGLSSSRSRRIVLQVAIVSPCVLIVWITAAHKDTRGESECTHTQTFACVRTHIQSLRQYTSIQYMYLNTHVSIYI